MAMRSIQGLLLVALAAMIWGCWSLFLRPAEALGPISPISEACLVQMAGSLVILPFAWRHGQRNLSWRIVRTVGLSALCDSASVTLFFAAMTYSSLSLATLTHNSAPLFVALLLPMLERRPLGRVVLGGLATSLVGLTLILSPWSGQSKQLLDDKTIGITLGLLSAVFFAGHVLLGKHIAKQLVASQNLAMHRVMSAALLALLAGQNLWLLLPQQYYWLLGGGALINGMAGMLFFTGLRTSPADKAAALTLLEPIMALLLSLMVWQQSLSLLALLGVSLVLASLYFIVTSQNPNDVAMKRQSATKANKQPLRYSA